MRRDRLIGSKFKVALAITTMVAALAISLGWQFWGDSPDLFAQEVLSGREILERVAAGQAGLQDFVADSQVEVKAPGIKWPKMKLRVYFKSPDKVHVESDRLALVPAGNLVVPDVRRLLAVGAVIERLEDETTDAQGPGPGADEYLILITPGQAPSGRRGKHEGMMRLAVDPDRWLITRALMQDPVGGEMEVFFSYTQVEGFWLPSLIRGEGQMRGFRQPPSVKGGSSTPGASNLPGGAGGGTNPGATLGGTEAVKLYFTVSYNNYRVNVGLSDKIFESRK
ncbi:MAG: hypothetical protein ACM3TT_08535 [Syntrophothermus sp.]